MKRSNTKNGFTLVEAMVLMLLASMVLAASTPLITKRHMEVKKIAHGMYICSNNTDGTYSADGLGTYSGGTYTERLFKNESKVYEKLDATSCTFNPPAKAEYFMVQILGGGGGGGYPGAMGGSSEVASGGGSIDVTYPDNDIANSGWLTTTAYLAKAPGVYISIYSDSGGLGGSQTGTVSGGPLTCTGGKRESSSGYHQTIPVQLGHMYQSVIRLGCDGASGTTINEGDIGSPTSGTAGQSGAVEVWGTTYSGGAATLMGGVANPIVGTACSSATQPEASVRSPKCTPNETPSVDTSPRYWYDHYKSYIWKYGLNGNGGKFDSMFLPSIKGTVTLFPGAGGKAADGANVRADRLSVNQGYPGGLTNIWAGGTKLLEKEGGAGGDGNQATSYIQIDTSGSGELTNSGSTWYRYGNLLSSATPDLQSLQLVGGFMSNYKLTQTGESGKGGRGGGTQATCQGGYDAHHDFYGYTGSFYTSCSTFSGGVTLGTGTNAAQKGTGGAVFIYW